MEGKQKGEHLIDMSTRRWALPLLVACLALPMLPGPAHAAFRGTNGALVYSRKVNGLEHLFVIRPDGTGRCRLTSGRVSDSDPVWSPDGSMVAFTRLLGTGHRAVFVTTASGSSVRRLTPATIEAAEPTWSPSGTRLAFACSRKLPGSAICVIGLDGTGLRALTNRTYRNIDPAWSPDGLTIAYSHAAGSHVFQVWAMKANGSNKHQVTHTKADELVSDWSPNGARILMTCALPSNEYEPELFAIRPDGSQMQRLTRDEYVTAAAWAPSGK